LLATWTFGRGHLPWRRPSSVRKRASGESLELPIVA
jgi:hypothetical protein